MQSSNYAQSQSQNIQLHWDLGRCIHRPWTRHAVYPGLAGSRRKGGLARLLGVGLIEEKGSTVLSYYSCTEFKSALAVQWNGVGRQSVLYRPCHEGIFCSMPREFGSPERSKRQDDNPARQKLPSASWKSCEKSSERLSSSLFYVLL